MNTRITDIYARDIRFPTSRHLDGSDAMNPAPDYSAAYVIIETDHPQGHAGHGMTFTIGRGNEVCVAAIRSLVPLIQDRPVEELLGSMGATYKLITGDSQLRWIGPEKGAIHLAAAALLNALWDLYGKIEGKPVWRLLADMSPQQIVDLIDWRYLRDALHPEQALEILQRRQDGKAERVQEMEQVGYPTYTTSAGWLGYSDDKMRQLARDALKEGWNHFKIKVGADIEEDVRRARLMREEIGYERQFMVDANQVWGVRETIDCMRRLAEFKPWFIEEPTSPDDILGHATIARAIAPIKVATGEHCHSAVMFKQFLQANAIDVVQIDSCRLASLNEIIAVLLMAEKFNKPVCPHAGGVGLCEYVQHISIFDYVCVSASLKDRVVEFVDHLHEHFFDPCVVRNGRYIAPSAPGYSITMKPESLDAHEFPNGSKWQSN